MEYPICPVCKGANTYEFEARYMCPDCSHEWSTQDSKEIASDEILIVKDANGTILQNGDTVITIKNLPVKGVSQSIKAGTKVKNIRLTEGDHNIDCKIEGFGAMGLKSAFVKKV